MTSVVIIGGGASGTLAALKIKTADKTIRVTILEKNEELLKKLKATGNGRCNLSNNNIPQGHLVTGFINSLGILTRQEEEGRIYPFSGRAKDVVLMLKEALISWDVIIKTKFSAMEVMASGSRFIVKSREGEELEADFVILASGGKAMPQLGATGDGFKMAKDLGISIGPVYPGLTHFSVKDYDTSLVGIRAKGKAILKFKGNIEAEESGEIQFSKKGISGIAIMNLSSLTYLKQEDEIHDYSLSLDFMEGFNRRGVLELLKDRALIHNLKIREMLLTVVPYELGMVILKRAGIKEEELNHPSITLGEGRLLKIASELKSMDYYISDLGGYKDAQITVGGVLDSEINMDTCESKRYKGLYITGELLDYAGPCGGYNLHHAFKTGIQAGNHIVESVKEKR